MGELMQTLLLVISGQALLLALATAALIRLGYLPVSKHPAARKSDRSSCDDNLVTTIFLGMDHVLRAVLTESQTFSTKTWSLYGISPGSESEAHETIEVSTDPENAGSVRLVFHSVALVRTSASDTATTTTPQRPVELRAIA